MNKKMVIFHALVLLSVFSTIESHVHESSCNAKTDCGSCIQTRNCAWCAQPDFGDSPRCFQPDLKPATTCPGEFVMNPDNEQITIKNSMLSQGGQSLGRGRSMYGSESGKVVQISPQEVKLKLRINQKHTISVKYAQAEDYPLDLYYLMDLSSSMDDDKEKLTMLGDTLAQTMRSVTRNFRLGFGSFIDKVVMPYVSTVPRNLITPCQGCEAPYGFKNIMKLSTNTDQFSEKVRNSPVSGNLDAPEGGFDAIMQAVVCKDQIGWREQARRVLVVTTDAGFHYAGDGKLGGIITPNDGLCHMQNNEYTHSKILDYPSVSQINLKAKENAINIIFAVTQQQQEVYKKLSEHIEGSSSVVLSYDSSNIVELIQDEYNKISSTVEMKDNAPESVKVKYFSKCLGKERLQTNTCQGLKVGDVVEFEAEIIVTSCPTDPKERVQTFQISPVGVGEALTVNLEMLCSCDCENGGPSYERNSPRCKHVGTLSCGVCECPDDFFGRNCECSDLHLDDSSSALNCRSDDETDAECSGRGNCICGQCHCNQRDNPEEILSGQFCECDNFSCDRKNGILCSGPDRGSCECGSCKCNEGFTGTACDCSTSVETCKAPNGKICSGHGKCECGRCVCDVQDDVRYSGEYCEKCPTCPGRCDELKSCVECQMYQKGELKASDDCAKNCLLFTPLAVATIDYDEELDEHLCTFYDEDNCRYQFVYSETAGTNWTVPLRVRSQEHPECPLKVNVWP